MFEWADAGYNTQAVPRRGCWEGRGAKGEEREGVVGVGG